MHCEAQKIGVGAGQRAVGKGGPGGSVPPLPHAQCELPREVRGRTGGPRDGGAVAEPASQGAAVQWTAVVAGAAAKFSTKFNSRSTEGPTSLLRQF